MIPGLSDKENCVLMPVIDNLWGAIVLSECMETSIHGLYVTGDATGQMRGIMQALCYWCALCGRNCSAIYGGVDMRKHKTVSARRLEETLEKSNEQYYKNFLAIKSRRESDFSTITSKEGTFDTHGSSHLDHIQEKLSELLGVNGIKKLNDLELYTLLCAICLHDISMAYTNKRAKHPFESAKIVESSTEYTWINNDIKYIVADIIRSHGMNNFEKYLYEKYHDGYSKYINEKHINVGVLMALLRIGDIMDWAYDRAPQTVREGMPVIGESFFYWYKHEPIQSIVPNRQEKTIIVTGRKFGKFASRILNTELDMLNQELNSNRQQLAKINLNFECFEFDYDTKKEFKWL